MLHQPAGRRFYHLALSPFIALLATVFLIGCQTVPFRSFPEVRVGMDKSEVIGLIGGPDLSKRWNGKDRWIYNFINDEPREIHFEDGKVIYAGTPIKIKVVSPEEQDRLNAEANKKEQEREEAEDRAWEERLGIARAKRATPEPNSKFESDLADIDRKLIDDLSGAQNLEAEKKKRAPVYEPID